MQDGGNVKFPALLGPGSATDGHLAVFDGTTGKLLKDGGVPGTIANPITYTGDPTGVSFGIGYALVGAVFGIQITNNTAADVDGLLTLNTGLAISFSDAAASSNEGLQSTSLTTLNLPNVVDASSYFFSGATLPALTSFSLPALVTAGYNLFRSAHFAALSSIDLSGLTSLGSNFCNNSNWASVTSFDISGVTAVDSNFFGGANLAVLVSLDLSSIVTATTSFFSGVTAPSLASLDLSGLTTVGGNLFSGTTLPSLVSFTLGVGLLSVDSDVSITGAALNQASVDNVLVRLVALNGTGGTTSYDNHTVDLSGGTSAAPSATGIAAAATLTGRGNTVTTN